MIINGSLIKFECSSGWLYNITQTLLNAFEANSGLYKYHTKEQIDSIYNWANYQIKKL